MRLLLRALALAAPLVPTPAQDERDRMELLDPPRLAVEFQLGMQAPAELFLVARFGSESLEVFLPFVERPGTDELRRLVQEQPASGPRHVDLAVGLSRRAGERRREAGLDRAAIAREVADLERDARFHLLEGERLLRSQLAETPSETAQLAYGRCLQLLGRDTEARELLAELVETSPDSWNALLALADVQYGRSLLSAEAFLRGGAVDVPGLARYAELRLSLIDRAVVCAPDRPEPYLARFHHFLEAILAELGSSAEGRWETDLLARLRADARRVRTTVALRQYAEDFCAVLLERYQIVPRRVAESSKYLQGREGTSISIVRAGVLQGHPNLAPRASW